MAAQLTLVPHDVIRIINNEPRTTSLKVAEVFGKLHKNVLQKIESLDCSEEFASANFSANTRTEQIGDRGALREFKYYEMTKDGFMFLVMGFTGQQAARIKEAYIAAFNWMAAQLFGQPNDSQMDKSLLSSIERLCNHTIWLRGWWARFDDRIRSQERRLAGCIHDHFVEAAAEARSLERSLRLDLPDRQYIENYPWLEDYYFRNQYRLDYLVRKETQAAALAALRDRCTSNDYKAIAADLDIGERTAKKIVARLSMQ